MLTKKVENLPVYIYDTREEMGAAAAKDAADRIKAIIARRGEANVIFAAAPSQNELLENLLKYDIDWSKVRGFHQDEYIGIDETEPAGFGCAEAACGRPLPSPAFRILFTTCAGLG